MKKRRQNKSKKYIKPIVAVLSVPIVFLFIIFIANIIVLSGGTYQKTLYSQLSTKYEISIEIKHATILHTTKYELPVGSTLITTNLPAFIKFEENSLVVNPSKADIGQYEVQFQTSSEDGIPMNYLILVQQERFDEEKVLAAIITSLGAEKNHYGVYLHDLTRNQIIEHNATKDFPPASISKLPSVVLTLRDIDSGKLSFDTQITVQDKYKHNFGDSIGRYAEGTKLPLRNFIDAAIIESNNTAHYHLHGEVLGGMADVNPRTRSELKADKFFLDPHVANANSIGNMLTGIYKGDILKNDTKDYLFSLMKNTLPSLRYAIPGGVPSGIPVASKVGFLYGGKEGDTYADAAIVFGTKSDYVLVVLNDKAVPFPNGYIKIQELSKVVYAELNK